jgi:hypothetical protein
VVKYMALGRVYYPRTLNSPCKYYSAGTPCSFLHLSPTLCKFSYITRTRKMMHHLLQIRKSWFGWFSLSLACHYIVFAQGWCMTTLHEISQICHSLCVLNEPGSVVGIATSYGLDGPEIECRWERDFLHLSRSTLGPT